MSQLPPPPRFTLPPPPMPPSDIFNMKIISQLTCSSIRQQTMTNSRLIVFASATVSAAILLLLITVVWLLLLRKQKPSDSKHNLKASQPPTSRDSIHDWSTCSSRSYETVSSDRTGAYLQSVNTSATTFSTDTTGSMCIQCYHQRGLQTAPYYHTLNIPDVVPN